jgi:hypothetical protein
MKAIPQIVTALLIAVIFIVACRKEQKPDSRSEAVSEEIKAKVKALGYSTVNIRKAEGGYMVESDIFLSEATLDHPSTSPTLVIARTEQYRTFNLVTGLPRVITVNATGMPASYIASVDAAISQYNALSLRLTFQRVATSADITITGTILDPGAWGASGPPDASGNPYSSILINTSSGGLGATPNVSFAASVIAHEMGHCIGFRHTDWMNRSYSCSTGGSEGESVYGAVQIPGTPSTEDAGSWMLACMGTNITNGRQFNVNDKVALQYLYGTPYTAYTLLTNSCTGISASYAAVNGHVGDVVVARANFSGAVSWNNTANGAGAQVSLTANGQSNGASSPHITTSGSFDIAATITFTVTAPTTYINTTGVIHNSSFSSAAGATLTIVSVNGVPNGQQTSICYGSSSGSW